MFYVTVWTDFGVPSTRSYAAREAAQAWGEFADKPHHTHACQHCGMVGRPARVNTVGVQFLPGYKNP